MTRVTAALRPLTYLGFIEREQDMSAAASLPSKIANLVLATAFLLPGALATLNQAALIVA